MSHSLVDEVKAVRMLRVFENQTTEVIAVSPADYKAMFYKLPRLRVACQTVNGEVKIMSVTINREAAIELLKDEYGFHHASH